ncbi:MAG: long-chain fatty acid--CoA ligase [Mycobacteriales bacterium]
MAVLSRNTIEHMEVFLACGIGGLLAQPLNWRLSVPELGRIVLDAGPAVLIADEEFSAVAAELAGDTATEAAIAFSTSDSASEYERLLTRGAAGPPVHVDAGDRDPFLILYTGGSTGRSKGVVHSHRSALAAMVNNTVAERIAPTDRYLLMSPMFHSPVLLALNYLTHGCPVVLMGFEATTALEAIEATRPTALIGMRTMLQGMLNVLHGGRHFDLSSIRNVQYGGSPMGTSFIPALMDGFPGDLLQCYGTTEAMGVTFLGQQEHRDARRTGDPTALQSCGRAAYLSEVRLVDTGGHPVPPDGVSQGEIAVRSEANMLGYWNRPAETAAVSLPGGWLRTGDIATWDERGRSFIVGRDKDVIRSGGESIYAAQVEQAISRHPAVADVAVIGVPDEEWGESVHAYVVLKSGRTAAAEELGIVAARELASYQRPRSIVFLPDLPRSITGKVQKQALRDLNAAEPGFDEPGCSSRS